MLRVTDIIVQIRYMRSIATIETGKVIPDTAWHGNLWPEFRHRKQLESFKSI